MAKKEYELLGDDIAEENRALVLREPQLASAQAQARQAQAALKLAELHLERSVLRAPFAGMVLSTNAERGSGVSMNAPLAEFVGTDVFWVEAQWREDQLPWLLQADSIEATVQANDAASAIASATVARSARFVRVLPEVIEGGGLVPVLFAVDNPLASENGAMPLLLNSFVDSISSRWCA